ncbi:MAG: hypothetical protein AAF417_06060 [Pseudomonadota bacterium]
MAKEQVFSAPKSRAAAATLGVLLGAILVTAGMPAWLPFSDANRIVMPIVLFPVTWLLLLFWVSFAKSMLRTWIGLAIIMAGNVVLIATTVGVL